MEAIVIACFCIWRYFETEHATSLILAAIATGAAVLIKHTAVKDRAVYLTTDPSGFEPNGRVNVEYLRGDQELYAREGLLTDPIDVATLVDLQYADYAVARLGRR